MPTFRLSCCAYSFRGALQGGAMTLFDFIERCREMELDGVELTSYYFPTTERSYLNQIKLAAHHNGLAISGTAVGTDFAQADSEARRRSIAITKEWVDHSTVLGAPTLRVFAGGVREGSTATEAFARAGDAMRECALYAAERGVILALENHHGLTGTAEDTLRLMHSVESPAIQLNLDLGNFDSDIYTQFAACAPHAVAAHAKPLASLSVGGAERVDYARVREILSAAGYRGYIAIEYEEAEAAETAVPAFAAELRAALR